MQQGCTCLVSTLGGVSGQTAEEERGGLRLEQLSSVFTVLGRWFRLGRRDGGLGRSQLAGKSGMNLSGYCVGLRFILDHRDICFSALFSHRQIV